MTCRVICCWLGWWFCRHFCTKRLWISFFFLRSYWSQCTGNVCLYVLMEKLYINTTSQHTHITTRFEYTKQTKRIGGEVCNMVRIKTCIVRLVRSVREWPTQFIQFTIYYQYNIGRSETQNDNRYTRATIQCIVFLLRAYILYGFSRSFVMRLSQLESGNIILHFCYDYNFCAIKRLNG